MIKNYFRIALRNLIRKRAYSAINITGLAVGIAASLLIFLVVRYELSYDKFQPDYNRIYRVVTNSENSGGNDNYNPGVPAPAFPALKADFPQFEGITPIVQISNSQVTVLGNDPNSDVAVSKKFLETGSFGFTYPEYFTIFHSKWLSGNPAALNQPGTIILNQSLATKYFGDWKQAMDQFVKLDNIVLLKVSGIIEDAPNNTDFPFEAFISYESYKANARTYFYSPEWGSLSSNHQVYVKLKPGISAASLKTPMEAFVKKNFGEGKRKKRTQVLQPLSEMHYDFRYGTFGDHSSSKTILWTLSLIGVLILIMASINFINLSTAQAVGRSKEVGVRKVLGGSRAQLIRQVMGETFLIVVVAVIFAIILAKLTMPFLSHVASVPASLPLFTVATGLFLLLLMLVVTLLSGIYPALVVSGFKPALALKNKIHSASMGGISLRRILVITQFAISQVLVVGTIVAITQMNYVRNADLGFNKDAVLVLPAYADSLNATRMNPFKQRALQDPQVLSVSFASDEASSDNNWASNFAFDNKNDEEYAVFHKFGDADYLKTYGLELIAGRNYTPSDTSKEYVVNEALMKKLGVKDAASMIGKNLRIGSGKRYPIVGVVRDFKTNSLRDEVKPLTIAPRSEFYFTIAVKLRTEQLAKTVERIQKLWESTYPEYAYTSHFVDDTIARFYQQETQLALLYKIFAGIAIFISCLGLYGLVSFMAAQKTKEVGIRKVLGASVANIVYLFSKEFTLLIFVAFVIAAPIAWYLMSNWLDNFVFRISIGIGVFALAIFLSLVIAWLTVGYKAVSASLANPVKSLRSE